MFSLQLFHRNSYKIPVFDSGFTRRGGLVRPASKSGRFSHHPLRVPKAWHGDFAACGQRSGLLALNLASIFEKLLDQKTFVCLRLVIENQLSNKFASQMWATRPHLGSIFEKLLHRKTFRCLRLASYSQSHNRQTPSVDFMPTKGVCSILKWEVIKSIGFINLVIIPEQSQNNG